MKEIYVNIKIVIVTPSQNQAVCNMAMEKNIYPLKFDENCFTNVGSLYNVSLIVTSSEKVISVLFISCRKSKHGKRQNTLF